MDNLLPIEGELELAADVAPDPAEVSARVGLEVSGSWCGVGFGREGSGFRIEGRGAHPLTAEVAPEPAAATQTSPYFKICPDFLKISPYLQPKLLLICLC